jgi:hypothetical protein
MRALAGAAITKTVLAAAMIAGLATMTMSAYAQEDKPALTRRSDAQKKEDDDIDKAYRAATKGDVIPSVKKDPWRIVRPADSNDKAKH